MEYRFTNTAATIAATIVNNQGFEQFVDGQGGDLHSSDGAAAIDAGDPAGLDWASDVGRATRCPVWTDGEDTHLAENARSY